MPRRPLAVSLLANPYFFTARRFDTETNLYYYRVRYYSPNCGRFLQTDPIGYQGGINLHAYCGNNPIILVDPTGFCTEPSDGKVSVELLDDPDAAEEFERIMAEMRERLQTDEWANKETRNPIEIGVVYGSWDSKYYEDTEYSNRLFNIGGQWAYGHEVNYYFMGMLMAYRGVPPWTGISMVVAYKYGRYGQLGVTSGTWHFFWRGYFEYNGPVPPWVCERGYDERDPFRSSHGRDY